MWENTVMKLKGKVALITASTREIGLAITKVFAKEGAIVYMAARNLELAKHEADKLNSKGGTVKYVFSTQVNLHLISLCLTK